MAKKKEDAAPTKAEKPTKVDNIPMYEGYLQVTVAQVAELRFAFRGTVEDIYTGMEKAMEYMKHCISQHEDTQPFRANYQVATEFGTLHSTQCGGPISEFEEKLREKMKAIELMTEPEVEFPEIDDVELDEETTKDSDTES